MCLQRQPRASLRPSARTLWASNGTAPQLSGTACRERVLPTGDMRLVFRLGAAPLRLFDDVAAVIASAVTAGAQVQMPPQDQFHGERSGRIRDPFGHSWNIGHSIAAVTPDEMQRRYTEMLKG